MVWLNEGAGKGGSLREVGSIKDPTKRKLTLSVSLKLFDGKEGGALLEAFCAHELGTHGVRAMADWRQPWAKNAKREVRVQGSRGQVGHGVGDGVDPSGVFRSSEYYFVNKQN